MLKRVDLFRALPYCVSSQGKLESREEDMRKRARNFPTLWDKVCEKAIGDKYLLLGAALKVARETALGDPSPKTRYEAKDWYRALTVFGLALLAEKRFGH